MFWRRKPKVEEPLREIDLSPIARFAEWIDAGAPGTERDEPVVMIAGWRVPVSLVEEWESQAPEHPQL